MHNCRFNVLLLFFCGISISQVLGELTAEQQYAQYANEKFSVEAEVFRMRCYVAAIEMNFPVKKINEEIVQKMTTLGVATENIEALKVELRDKAREVDANLIRIMEDVRLLRITLGEIYTDIETDLTKIPLDEALMHSDFTAVDTAYYLSDDNIELTMEFMTLRIESELIGFTGPEVDEIKALTAEANSLMGVEQVNVRDAKVLFDRRHIVARDTLHALNTSKSQK